jgi:hypothetical protein
VNNVNGKYDAFIGEIAHFNIREAKAAMTKGVLDALQDLKDTLSGGTAENYKKRELALMTLDAFRELKRSSAVEKKSPVITGVVTDSVKKSPTPVTERNELTEGLFARKIADAQKGRSLQTPTANDHGEPYAFQTTFQLKGFILSLNLTLTPEQRAEYQLPNVTQAEFESEYEASDKFLKDLANTQAVTGQFDPNLPGYGTFSGFIFPNERAMQEHRRILGLPPFVKRNE